MNEQEVREILSEVGAVITDSHIVYTQKEPTLECPSGWFHGEAYINKDVVYPHVEKTSRLCLAIAERFAGDNVEVVIGPAMGGVILSQWVAYHSMWNFHTGHWGTSGKKVLSVYAEKEVVEIPCLGYGPPGCVERFVISRGYDKLITGKRVLVVEDVLTSGGSAKKVVEATRAVGGNVVGLGALVNRGGVTSQDVANVPRLEALVSLKLDKWPEETCPLCERDVPINTDVGWGREFLARRR